MFGKKKEKINGELWDWKNFKTTEGFPISENLLDWVVGQKHAMKECRLCLDEWMHKLKGLKKRKWWRFWEKPESEKPSAKDQLSPAPSLFLLGDAGTGKSLMGRALTTYLNHLYKKFKIPLYDVICWKNEIIPSEPRISIIPSPKGKEIIKKLRIKALKKNWWSKWFFRLLQGVMIGFGLFILSMIIFYILNNWITNVPSGFGYPFQEIYEGNFLRYFIEQIMVNAQMFFIGIGSLSMGAMLFIFKHIIGSFGGAKKGVGGAESLDSPKLIVDNSSGKAPFIDATGHGSSQLFGSIAWDPYQTGGLGTPEHQRVSAGGVHRAFMGILYIDEIKNLSRREAVTLLTVLEDGQLPIALRSHGSVSGNTAAMSVATEPVPCLNFLVAAGNFDSIPQIHPALMDRITGYGKIVRMNNEMSNTVDNRRKYVQFIAQEIKRFDLLPFSKEACEELVNEGRRKSGFNNKLTTKFRPMISIIKTASILAMNKKEKIVEAKYVVEAINEHCKTIQKQLLEYFSDKGKNYKYIEPTAEPRQGKIHGLYVRSWGEEGVGAVGVIKASMIKREGKKQEGYFKVSGIVKKAKWIDHSIDKVGHVIEFKFGVDPTRGYSTMIDFQQQYHVDGPSAGITMTLALASIIKKKKIRQDIAVTGEINIDSEGEIIITPIGGADQKIRAAMYWGFKKVIIPKKNFDYSIKPSDYKGIEIVGCETLEQYMKEVFVDE